MISVKITTPEGDKTIGMITNLKEFEWAMKEIEKKAREVLK